MPRLFSTGAWAALILVVLSAGALWMNLTPGPPEPTPAQWEAVGGVIAPRLEEGDAIRVHPFWLRESTALLKPFGAQKPALDLSLPADPIFAARHRRLWIVSAMGRTDAPVPAGAELIEETFLDGAIGLRLYRLPDSPIRADLLAQLQTARVERWARGADQKKRRCVWRRDKYDCKGRPWENVAVSEKHVAGAARRCLVLHPYPDGGFVSVTWPQVELDAGLYFRTGFTLDAARNEKGSDASFSVLVDGVEVVKRREKKNGWDWTPGWIDTSAQRRGRADITVQVTAAQEEFRDLCVDLYVMSEEPAGYR